MHTLAHKKLILLGMRDGISDEAMQKVLAPTGAEVLYSVTEGCGCSWVETLGQYSQKALKKIFDTYDSASLLVILGSADKESARLYASLVTLGGPAQTGALAELQMGLCVYHILEDDIKRQLDPNLWTTEISMMERILDTPALQKTVAEIRILHSKYSL